MSLRKEMWQTKKIAEVCEEIFAGGDVPKNSFSKTPTKEFSIPIYSNGEKNKGLYGYTDINRVRKTSLTISARGTIGYTEIRAKDFYPAVRLIVVTPNSDVLDLSFLKVVISNTNLASFGTSIPQLTVPMIKQYEILVPPIEEQKQIASLFQSIETVIELIETQERNLISLKRQLLRALFSNIPKFGNYLTKNDFEHVKYEQLASNISERVEPKETQLKIYIGLEHLDSDTLTIERTGKPEDVIGTKLKIYKGDIIFGKRRAYLRKVAVSHFDGIASAHSMILRANEMNIEKDFLPYFMQSDTFMDRAIQISEGSLSPTIKWKTLATQEFILPKKEKQVRLIETFKQFDATTNLLKQQISTLRTLKQNLLNEILG